MTLKPRPTSTPGTWSATSWAFAPTSSRWTGPTPRRSGGTSKLVPTRRARPAGSSPPPRSSACDLIRIGPLGGLPASGIRHYLGDQTAQLLGVPKADWTRWFFTFVEVSDSLFDRTWARLPGVPNLSAVLGLRMLRGFELTERGG